MRKRLRKKKHVCEFTDFGFPVAIRLVDGANFDLFLDEFIEDAIEANSCYFGGGGKNGRISGIVQLGLKTDLPEQRLKEISNWLDSNSKVSSHLIGETNDLWYGTFDDLETIEEKI